MNTLSRWGVVAFLLPFAIGARIPVQPRAASTSGAVLGPVDTYFATQTSLGTPFQVDSGRLAQTKGGTEAIRAYAQLMVSSHITVNNALEAILKRKAPIPPPTLLQAAYTTMVSTLQPYGQSLAENTALCRQVRAATAAVLNINNVTENINNVREKESITV
jgi:predicted outer membrane protein